MGRRIRTAGVALMMEKGEGEGKTTGREGVGTTSRGRLILLAVLIE